MSKKESKGGRPRKYETPEQLEERIEAYFNGGMNTKTVYVGKDKEPIEVPVPTISGLALFLGFADRYSMYDYEKKTEFAHTIKKARTAIEQHYEELLQSGVSPSGAIFALKNFGWKDKTEIENTNLNVEISDKDRAKILKDLEGEL